MFATATSALGLCSSFPMLAVFTFVYGVMEGGYHSQRMTLLSEFLSAEQIANAVGWSIFAQGTGNLISAPLLGRSWESQSFVSALLLGKFCCHSCLVMGYIFCYLDSLLCYSL